MPKKPRRVLPAALSAVSPADTQPLWQGPEVDGITYSLLCRFLACRERFRVHALLGLRPADDFNHRLEYGSMWHVCEEAHAANPISNPTLTGNWEMPLVDYCKGLTTQYPLRQQQVAHWYSVCRTQFPHYVAYWSQHPEMSVKENLLSEYAFRVPYQLPCGRVVTLRGKFDSVDRVRVGRGRYVTWLQENKTRGDVDAPLVERQLKSGFDLQTMLYMTALQHLQQSGGDWERDALRWPLGGVRYNVVRRPLAGGTGTIVRHKATQGSKCPKCRGVGVRGIQAFGEARDVTCEKCRGSGRVGAKPEETGEAYYTRLGEVIGGNREHYFARWNVGLQDRDIGRFRRECLDPILEHLCGWYDALSQVGKRSTLLPSWAQHYRHPYGVYNPIDESGWTEVDDFLLTGSTVGLRRAATLFPELEEVSACS